MILIIIFKEWSHILGIMMDDENEKIALEVLRDFLKTNFSFEGSFEHEVKAHILSAKDEEKYLISAENKIFHERVKFKIRELEENLELKKYQKRFYPHELYTKDKKTQIDFLNDNYIYECLLCKKNNLVLIPSGKVWFCKNRYCNGKQFLTIAEKELLNITYEKK